MNTGSDPLVYDGCPSFTPILPRGQPIMRNVNPLQAARYGNPPATPLGIGTPRTSNFNREPFVPVKRHF